jgi:hypothetical protein
MTLEVAAAAGLRRFLSNNIPSGFSFRPPFGVATRDTWRGFASDRRVVIIEIGIAIGIEIETLR